MDGVGAADVRRARLRQAEEAHLACGDELAHGAGDILDRHRRVDAVLVEQVDVVGPQPLQRALDGRADVLRAAVGPASDLLAVLEPEAELGGDHHLVAAALKRPRRAAPRWRSGP